MINDSTINIFLPNWNVPAYKKDVLEWDFT